jgi:tetratricopeptide (TPR) repeat protein
MESEYKATEVQNRLEEVELELNSVKEESLQSQQELQKLLADQEETIEQRCRDVQCRLDEVIIEFESTKAELASSGSLNAAAALIQCDEHQLTPCNSEEECALTLNNMALLLKKSNRLSQLSVPAAYCLLTIRHRIAEALPLYSRALELRQRALGDNHIELTPIMVNIGALHFMDGKYSDASSIFEVALEIRKQELGVEHSQTVSTQQWLSKCQAKLEDGAGVEGGE